MDAFDEPTTQVLKPDNQLQLTEKELEEEITKQLTANNPNAPSNIARYSMKERTFKFEPMVEQLVMHYATDGYLLHQESDEAKRQVALEEMEAQAFAEWSAGGKPAEKKEGEEGAEGAEEGADGDAEGAEEAAPAEPHDDSKQLRNQFNFAERSAQTVNNAMRDRASATEPPATCLLYTSPSPRDA